jgi:hypothetical protein
MLSPFLVLARAGELHVVAAGLMNEDALLARHGDRPTKGRL